MAYTVEEVPPRPSVPRAPRTNPKSKDPHYNTGPLEYSCDYLAQCKLERHEPGRIVAMKWTEADETVISIPSETLVRTKGSALAMEEVDEDPHQPSKVDTAEVNLTRVSPRACTHFSHDRVCLRGSRCYFLHVLCIRPPNTNDSRVTAKEQHGRDASSASRGLSCRGTMPKHKNKTKVAPAAPATAMPNVVFAFAPQWQMLPQQPQVLVMPPLNAMFAPAPMPGAAIPLRLMVLPQQPSQPADQSTSHQSMNGMDGLSACPLFLSSVPIITDLHQASVLARARAQATW